MKKNMKKQNEPLFAPPSKKINFKLLVIVLCCIICDSFCVWQFSSIVYNENFLYSALVSFVIAISLDVSLAYAANFLNSPPSNNPTRRKRQLAALWAMFAVFFLSFVSMCMIAFAAQEASDSQNPFQNGTIARLIVPIFTSILSFAIGWDLNPADTHLQKLKYQRTKMALELADAKANAQRMRSAMEFIDPNAYDLAMLHLALQRVKTVTAEAQYKLRIALAEELGTTAASDMLKNSQDIVDISQIQRQLEHQAERIDIVPTAEHHSGRFPESIRDNNSPSP